jgi:hypothetical protein
VPGVPAIGRVTIHWAASWQDCGAKPARLKNTSGLAASPDV